MLMKAFRREMVLSVSCICVAALAPDLALTLISLLAKGKAHQQPAA
jgi:hypothetical protein